MNLAPASPGSAAAPGAKLSTPGSKAHDATGFGAFLRGPASGSGGRLAPEIQSCAKIAGKEHLGDDSATTSEPEALVLLKGEIDPVEKHGAGGDDAGPCDLDQADAEDGETRDDRLAAFLFVPPVPVPPARLAARAGGNSPEVRASVGTGEARSVSSFFEESVKAGDNGSPARWTGSIQAQPRGRAGSHAVEDVEAKNPRPLASWEAPVNSTNDERHPFASSFKAAEASVNQWAAGLDAAQGDAPASVDTASGPVLAGAPQTLATLPSTSATPQALADTIVRHGTLPAGVAGLAAVPSGFAAQEHRVLKIQLHPTELGAVTARLRFTGGQLSVDLSVETDAARERLGADGGASIANALAALGLEVERVTVALPPDAATASSGARNNQTGGETASFGAGSPGRNKSGDERNGQASNGRSGEQADGLRMGDTPARNGAVFI